MIIFDLDGTLADCNHRKYLIDEQGIHPAYFRHPCPTCNDGSYHMIDIQFHKATGKKWKPNWNAFFEACSDDLPIKPVIMLFRNLLCEDEIQIWSGRSESVREKTMQWISENIYERIERIPQETFSLKMRPIGDYTPDEVLKEKWLNEALAEGKKIQFVFDDRPKVVQMWRQRGIFVFNCLQNDGEF